MSPATTFRAAVGAAVVAFIVAIAAIVNHFISKTAHPAFGLKVAVVLILIGLACGIYANYNRPVGRA